jgi:phosphoglycerate dehydrogenase-like enzyme
MAYVKIHNIEIHNARGVYSIPMAEFAVSGVLQLYKQSRFFYERQKNHQWEKNRNLLELTGKIVTIVGCGSVGNECAKRFNAFECKVVGVDIYPREDRSYSKMVNLDELDNILPMTDVLILTLPLTEETRHLMNASRFKKLKDGAILVNIARGAVVDTEAMILNLNKLAGAVIDVYEEEPLEISSKLWDMENVLLTPHNSFVGDRNRFRLANVILDNLEEHYE